MRLLLLRLLSISDGRKIIIIRTIRNDNFSEGRKGRFSRFGPKNTRFAIGLFYLYIPHLNNTTNSYKVYYYKVFILAITL